MPISGIASKAFSEALFERMNWINDYKFQFRGIFRECGTAKILFFSLDEPRIYLPKSERVELEGRSACDKDTPKQTIQYISHRKETHSLQEAIGSWTYAYPAEWENNIGLTSAMRIHRDSLTENITEQDILLSGTYAINPLIGELPTKQEVMEELEELLITM